MKPTLLSASNCPISPHSPIITVMYKIDLTTFVQYNIEDEHNLTFKMEKRYKHTTTPRHLRETQVDFFHSQHVKGCM